MKLKMLQQQGLIKGGNLDNAIVIVDRDLKNEDLKVWAIGLGIKRSRIMWVTNGMLIQNAPFQE